MNKLSIISSHSDKYVLQFKKYFNLKYEFKYVTVLPIKYVSRGRKFFFKNVYKNHS